MGICNLYLPKTPIYFVTFTAQKMKFLVKDFFIKCDQISSFLRIWSHLLKKSLIENFIFCAVITRTYLSLLFHTHTHTRARTHTRLCVKIPENFFSLLFHGKISFHFSCNLFQVCHPTETTCTDPANHTQQKHRSCIYNFFCDFFYVKNLKILQSDWKRAFLPVTF